MQVKILIAHIRNIDGKSVVLESGEVVNLPKDAAEHAVNAGYAELFKNPAVKVVQKPPQKVKPVKKDDDN